LATRDWFSIKFVAVEWEKCFCKRTERKERGVGEYLDNTGSDRSHSSNNKRVSRKSGHGWYNNKY
jgi:hypothetical protein